MEKYHIFLTHHNQVNFLPKQKITWFVLSDSLQFLSKVNLAKNCF
jgi:hypothetical protein